MDCKEKEYGDYSDMKCKSCMKECKNCTNGSSCIACMDNSTTLINGSCECPCGQGIFRDEVNNTGFC